MIDYDEKRKKLVLDMANFLMEVGQEYCPWTVKNMTEAMQNFPDSVSFDIALHAGAANGADNIVLNAMFAETFNRSVYEYYRPLALEKAEAHIVSERELANEDIALADQLRDFQPDEE